VPVKSWRLNPEATGEGAQAEGIQTLVIEEAQGFVDDLLPVQRHWCSLRDVSNGVRHTLLL
jgi:hypothetical protein